MDRKGDYGYDAPYALTASVCASWLTRRRLANADSARLSERGRRADRETLELRRTRSKALCGRCRLSPTGRFDVVVSSLAIHNISSNAARTQAISEAWRVLKGGGRLAIADIRATKRYAETLSTLGATGVTRRRLGWRFWYGNPAAGTTLVTASKPGRT